MSEQFEREIATKRIARRIEGELREALGVMPTVLGAVERYDYEYGTPDPMDQLEGLLAELEPVTSRLVELSRRMR